MRRIALLRSVEEAKPLRSTPTERSSGANSFAGVDAGYIQVWLPIDFTFGRRGTVTGEELGFVTDRRIYGKAVSFDAERRYKFVQWMPLSKI